MRVELRPEARSDLIRGGIFYETRRGGLGDVFAAQMFSDLRKLQNEAGIHPVVFGAHRKLTHKFPFAIRRTMDALVGRMVA